jgi:hypothetical protein
VAVTVAAGATVKVDVLVGSMVAVFVFVGSSVMVGVRVGRYGPTIVTVPTHRQHRQANPKRPDSKMTEIFPKMPEFQNLEI